MRDVHHCTDEAGRDILLRVGHVEKGEADENEREGHGGQ